MIYFIQAGRRGPIKIGYAKDVLSRAATIQCHNHVPLTLLRVKQGGFVAERTLHRRFQKSRRRGEWFSPSPDLLQYLKRLPKPPKATTLALSIRLAVAEANGAKKLPIVKGRRKRMGNREATIIWRNPKLSVKESIDLMPGWRAANAYKVLGKRDVPAGRRPK